MINLGLKALTQSLAIAALVWTTSASSHDPAVASAEADAATITALELKTSISPLGRRGPIMDDAVFSADGRYIAIGFSNGVTHVWDVEANLSVVEVSTNDKRIRGVAFSPDGRWIATGAADRTARIWDVSTGELLHTFRGHTEWVEDVVFSSDGSRLVTAGRDGFFKAWDTSTGDLVYASDFSYLGTLWSIELSPDGTKIATGSGLDLVQLWDAASGAFVREFRGHTDAVRAIAFSPDGKSIASGSADTTARVWDTETAVLATLFDDFGERRYPITLGEEVRAVDFDQSGRFLATVVENTGLQIWDLAKEEVVVSSGAEHDSIRNAFFSPDGEHIATIGSYDSKVNIWRLK